MKLVDIIIAHDAISQAIKSTQKLGVKPSLLMRRYRNALALALGYNERSWASSPKRKRYEKAIRYYQKKLGE